MTPEIATIQYLLDEAAEMGRHHATRVATIRLDHSQKIQAVEAERDQLREQIELLQARIRELELEAEAERIKE